MHGGINHAYPKCPPVLSEDELVGIGLRYPYYESILETDLNIGWLEVHPENYFGGGAHRHFLSKAREKFPLSFHAVGLSLGSDQDVCQKHLAKFRALIDAYDPFQISDHASWSMSGNAHLNDLLPLPYTFQSLDKLAQNVDAAQTALGRKMLIENPSTYVTFDQSDMSEAVFMNRLAEKTGCGILLDINNIYVQANNHGFDAYEYLDTIAVQHVEEMHLAGHTEQTVENQTLFIDTHNRPVKKAVWDLYAHAIKRFGLVPTLIEWDQDFPSLNVLVGEADKARDILRHAKTCELENATP